MKILAILIGAAMLLPCFTPSADAGHRRHVRVVCRPHRCHSYVWLYHHHHRGHHHHWNF